MFFLLSFMVFLLKKSENRRAEQFLPGGREVGGMGVRGGEGGGGANNVCTCK
jgi:hypothetical protein